LHIIRPQKEEKTEKRSLNREASRREEGEGKEYRSLDAIRIFRQQHFIHSLAPT
jgi:hypothetical protein